MASSDVIVLPLASVIVKSSWEETGAMTGGRKAEERCQQCKLVYPDAIDRVLTIPLERLVPRLLLQLHPRGIRTLPVGIPECREGVGLAPTGEGEAYVLARRLIVVKVACEPQRRP